MDTTGEKEKRTSKKNVERRSTSSHDKKKFRNRSVGKQRGMAFGFRKTATAVIKRDGWMDGWMDGWKNGWKDGWMEEWMDGRNNGWMDGWTDGWKN